MSPMYGGNRKGENLSISVRGLDPSSRIELGRSKKERRKRRLLKTYAGLRELE